MITKGIAYSITDPSSEDVEYVQGLLTKFQHEEYIRKKLKPNMKLEGFRLYDTEKKEFV